MNPDRDTMLRHFNELDSCVTAAGLPARASTDATAEFQMHLLSKLPELLSKQATSLTINCIWWRGFKHSNDESPEHWTHYASVLKHPFFHLFN